VAENAALLASAGAPADIDDTGYARWAGRH